MSLPRLAVVVAGFAIGALARRWQAREVAALRKLSREMRLLEARVTAHDAQLKEAPSTAQMMAAMDDLLAKAMAGLDERLTAQAQSIETLQLTVTQTDELLERVLESLDLLREA